MLSVAISVLATGACGGAGKDLPPQGPESSRSSPSAADAAAREAYPLALDFDQDGVPNLYDRCPGTKEDAKAAKIDGCATPEPSKGAPPIKAKPPAELTDDSIVINSAIQFEHGKAVIRPESAPVIGSVAHILKTHPEVELLEVAGHADKTGSEAVNLWLTNERAAAVRDALVAQGVGESRVRPAGYGAWCPLDPADSDEARAKNRRVEFKIIAKSGKPVAAWGGCEEAKSHGIAPPAVAAQPTPAPPTPAAPLASAKAPAGKPGGAASPPPMASSTPPAPAARCFEECACDKGNGRACRYAADNARNRTDPVAAYKLNQRACDLGDLEGCHDAGVSLSNGRGIAADPARGVAMLKRAWDGGYRHSAQDYGAMLARGEGTGKDVPAGIAVIQEGCDLGEAYACQALANLYAGEVSFRNLVPKDNERALTYAAKACELGDAVSGCPFALRLWKQGVGRAQRATLWKSLRRATHENDLNKIGDLFRLPLGSDRLASAVETARRSMSHGWELLRLIETEYKPVACAPTDASGCQASCQAGVPDSCARLGFLHAYGQGVPRDADKAYRALAEACSYGSTEGCQGLWLIFEDRATSSGSRALNPYHREYFCKVAQSPAHCLLDGFGSVSSLSDLQGVDARSVEKDPFARAVRLLADEDHGGGRGPHTFAASLVPLCGPGMGAPCGLLARKVGAEGAKYADDAAKLRAAACKGGFLPACAGAK